MSDGDGQNHKAAVDGLAAQAKADGRTLHVWDADLTGFGMLATKPAASALSSSIA